jgi:hypothetical protein
MGWQLIVMSRSSVINFSHQDLPPAYRGSVGFEPSTGEGTVLLRIKRRGGSPYATRNKYGVPGMERQEQPVPKWGDLLESAYLLRIRWPPQPHEYDVLAQ